MLDASIKRVAFVSLGCPKNLVDSEQMLATIVESGYEIVADHDKADAIIINTCGFLEDRKSTRLNSSHVVISYAVFCLKKKK